MSLSLAVACSLPWFLSGLSCENRYAWIHLIYQGNYLILRNSCQPAKRKIPFISQIWRTLSRKEGDCPYNFVPKAFYPNEDQTKVSCQLRISKKKFCPYTFPHSLPLGSCASPPPNLLILIFPTLWTVPILISRPGIFKTGEVISLVHKNQDSCFPSAKGFQTLAMAKGEGTLHADMLPDQDTIKGNKGRGEKREILRPLLVHANK